MTIRIGMASYWHVHAWDYTRQAQEHPDTEIVAVWDENEERGREAAAQLGVPYYAKFDEMLANPEIDAIIVDAPTDRHEEIITAAANAGKHIFTEKVLAPTVQEAVRIMKEIELNGVKLTVSLPRLNDGYTLSIQDILEQNLLGQITYVRVRLSHNGALAGWLPEHFYNLQQCAGGALIDLGCHPMYLTRLFLNQEITGVSANFGYITGKEVEDNAVVSLYTATGAIGVVEAGFVNSYSPFSIEVHGTEGTLLYGTPDETLRIRSNRENLGEAWHERSTGSNRESAFEQWVQHIQKDTRADENIRIALELTSLMEAANRSAQEGRVIRPAQLGE